MQIISVTDPLAIASACSALSRGELVIYPTETCYGIAVDTTNAEAITRLLAYKGDRHRQVAIAVESPAMASKFVELNDIADNLYTHFLPGPITVISKSLHTIDERLESEGGGLGIRIPKHDFALNLIKTFGKPITATSANTSGKKEPYSLEDWQKYTTYDKQNMVSIFLSTGKLKNRPTSTVVDTMLNDPRVLRQGGLIIPGVSSSSISRSTEETMEAARTIITKYLPLTRRFPLILALQGDLGVGKTQFVKGVAHALGVDVNVSSPTYNLMKEYPYKIKAKKSSEPCNSECSELSDQDPKYFGTIYHIDTWRLSDPIELDFTLHLKDLLKPGNILAIEWASKASNLLKSYEKDTPILVINIKEINEQERLIKYAFSTPEWS